MPLDCLNNLIGVRGACGGDTEPESVYYINDLPGIGLKQADAAMSEEDASAWDFLKAKVDQAGDIVSNDIRTHFLPRFKAKSILSRHVVGNFRQNLDTTPAQATYLVGKNFYISESDLELRLDKIGLHLDTTGDIDVFVWDLTSNKLLDTISVTGVTPGVVTYVDVSKRYLARGQELNLFIGYTATFASYKTDITANGCTSCKRVDQFANPYITVTSSKILAAGNKIDDNLESNSNLDGLSVTYTVNCSMEPWICSARGYLAQAIWYKAGALIAEEMELTPRFNSITNLKRLKSEELMVRYEDRYAKSMETVLQMMTVPDSTCYNCNRLVSLKTRTP